jgi:hypothetical protein
VEESSMAGYLTLFLSPLYYDGTIGHTIGKEKDGWKEQEK